MSHLNLLFFFIYHIICDNLNTAKVLGTAGLRQKIRIET